MEKWSESVSVLQPKRGQCVNWDGAVNRGYPQFTPEISPNLAKMTNFPPRRRWEVWKFDPFYTFISKGASSDGNKNGHYRIVLIIDL